MSSTSTRRTQSEKAAAIDHAIDLKGSHGSSFAIHYLRMQCIQEDTIQRIMFGAWCDHRVPHYLPRP
jgi:hypothetical protein